MNTVLRFQIAVDQTEVIGVTEVDVQDLQTATVIEVIGAEVTGGEKIVNVPTGLFQETNPCRKAL